MPDFRSLFGAACGLLLMGPLAVAAMPTTSTATSDFQLSVSFSSASFVGMPGVPEEFLDFEFSDTGFFDLFTNAQITDAGSVVHTAELDVDGTPTNPGESFFWFSDETITFSVLTEASAVGPPSDPLQPNLVTSTNSPLFSIDASSLSDHDILLVFDYTWSRDLDLSNTGPNGLAIGFLDAQGVGETPSFEELNTIVDGSADGLNIGYTQVGAISVPHNDVGQLFFTLPAADPDGFVQINISADILMLAEVTAVPLPAGLLLLGPAVVMLGWRTRRH